ncbi:ATP-binding protein [Hymenobacter negativus]|uniref:Tetratricopeptide repeat protein n=1 Tax=Hymenobacter negativus TaxID=2795026 RepID=A0ABS3QDP3_9BACT|nr:ATP-binding protein [Hymenobacter negativus]MBO2009364.1 tetratricopeptide repeat protein [Hymenobacter negativus]
MKKWLLCGGLLLGRAVSVQAVPLPPAPDSLRALLGQALPDTPARTAALLRVTRAYAQAVDPRTVPYAQAAAAQARQLADAISQGRALDVLGRYYSQTYDDARALPLLRQAEPLLAEVPPAERVSHLTHLADAYAALRRPGPARSLYGRAYALVATVPPAQRGALQADLLNSLGALTLENEQYDSAAYFLYAALRRQQQLGRVQAEAETMLNVAALHYFRKQFGPATRFARQALARQRQLHDTLALAQTYNYLGTLAREQPDSLRAALTYFRAAGRQWRRNHQEAQLQLVFNNLATTYRLLKEADSTEVNYRRALAVQQQHNQITSIELGRTQTNLAGLLVIQHRLAEAQQLGRSALQLAEHDHQPTDAIEALAVLRDVALARHDYPTAYHLLERQQELGQTESRRQNERLVEELRVGYETEQAEQQVALLTQQQEVARLRQQRTTVATIAALLLLAGAAAGGVLLYRRRQRRQERALRQRLAADLHDDVGSLLTQVALEGALLRHEQPTPTQLTRVNRLVAASQQAVRQLRDVAWSVDSANNSFAALLERLRDHAHEVLPLAGVEVDFQLETAALSGEPLSLAALQALYLIYKEALHNVVKHACPVATTVVISLGREGQSLRLVVEDDGPGLPTAGPRAAGHGLLNMRRRAGELGGEVRYEPAPAGGLRVVVRLPLASRFRRVRLPLGRARHTGRA